MAAVAVVVDNVLAVELFDRPLAVDEYTAAVVVVVVGNVVVVVADGEGGRVVEAVIVAAAAVDAGSVVD